MPVVIPPVAAPASLLQRIGDLLKFPGGLLAARGAIQQGQNLVHDPAGPGRLAPQGAVGGLLGSMWRNPAAVEQYAAQQGIPAGLLAPVGPRAAAVMEHPATKANRLWDEGQTMSDARLQAMTVKSLSDLDKGAQVQMHPATDAWMSGDRYGKITGFNKAKGYFRVKMDVSGRTRKVTPDNVLRRLPPDWLPSPREGASRTPWADITQAQWGQMHPMQRRVWLRDSNYDNWPPTIRQAFRLNFPTE